MIESYKLFWRKSFVFAGKTTRLDFWLTAAANAIILVGIIALGVLLVSLLGDSATVAPFALLVLYAIATIVPNIAIQARRLRDAGFTPWLLLTGLIPYVGGIIILIMTLQPSKASS